MNAGELAARVLEQITAHPETYDQRWFYHRDSPEACGSTACAAGWAVALGLPGARPAWRHRGLSLEQTAEFVFLLPGSYESVNVREVAGALLGLDAAHAYWLFDEDRTPAQVASALEELSGGEMFTVPDLVE